MNELRKQKQFTKRIVNHSVNLFKSSNSTDEIFISIQLSEMNGSLRINKSLNNFGFDFPVIKTSKNK